MLIPWLLVLAGLILLVAGGEALVRGATGLALAARVTPAVAGLTIVAAGTSMPEFVVSLQSALENRPGLAVGNVVGSNIFNIGAILGLTALVKPLVIQGNTTRFEWPVMVSASVLVVILGQDLRISRPEGVSLAVLLVAFTAYAVWIARRKTVVREKEEFAQLETASMGKTGGAALALNGAAVLLGVGLLAGGSRFLISGASRIAAGMGVSETIIGLTIVAAGTSMPELVTSLVAAFRGRDDIAVTNIVGSNIFNVLGILGVAGTILPLDVPPEIVARDNWWMLGVSLLLFPLMRTGMRVTRREGALLLAIYVVYAVVLIRAA